MDRHGRDFVTRRRQTGVGQRQNEIYQQRRSQPVCSPGSAEGLEPDMTVQGQATLQTGETRMYSRREFAGIAAATIPLARTLWAVNSTIHGVRMGVQSASFT